MTTRPLRSRHRLRGFTLMELMIAVVVVAILAMIALPSYFDQVRRTRRADAKIALSTTAQTLERCMTQFGRYDDAACSVAAAFDSADGYYRISVVRDAASFTISASPQNAQDKDRACTRFTLNQLGVRAATGEDGDAGSRCW